MLKFKPWPAGAFLIDFISFHNQKNNDHDKCERSQK